MKNMLITVAISRSVKGNQDEIEDLPLRKVLLSLLETAISGRLQVTLRTASAKGSV